MIDSRHILAEVALGETPADLAIINAGVVNVYTAELLSGYSVLIKGDRIAYVGAKPRGIGSQTRVIDAGGKVLVPGFIDGHTHFDYLVSTSELVRCAMRSGTTAIITETVADEQMLRFTKTRKPGEIMNRRLWRYSRHPNYFGEISFWWGLYFFGLAANYSYWWTIAGPIAITALFLFISIPMMDKRSLERRPEYAEHMKKTSALVPWQAKR